MAPKQANVLAPLPKSAHPGALTALRDIYNAEDIDVLLEFYNYPAEHWVHLCTTIPIAGTLAVIRLRIKVTKGPGSRAARIAMGYKLIDAAQARWRAVNASHLVALVRAGAVFHKGTLLERPIHVTPAEPGESAETEVA